MFRRAASPALLLNLVKKGLCCNFPEVRAPLIRFLPVLKVATLPLKSFRVEKRIMFCSAGARECPVARGIELTSGL